ncbi:cation channel sperm-associated protein 3 isoform X1 [Oncorhynchus kisutch]|uniref:Cation channel sperm associated 3 n=1 Tax=Oncorhynchus kisutch TaxID=8019 RepID=A0A8C7JLR4_ONCKI|nr:cation channel sperm-associated protein 3 isoform X1 [Oncorhynchus kisutch]XP_046186175.1 cation channel sperm-associated protein 3-like isoform X1 [Oncorhynchus gorbuscha]XP_052385246.1 cation channel sperm-associated protein 3-like isoform X1 [Oncorhynchus keta]
MEQNADVKESGSGYFRFIIQKGASQIALRRFSDWDAVGRAAATAAGLNVRKDTEFYDYIANITEKTLFDGMIMVTIILNALFMALETDYDMKYKLFGFFAIADEFFMAIYTMEFLMKVYVNPGVYWKNGYNVFDAIILVISFVPMFADGGDSSAMGTMRIVRAFRSLRVLKTVSFIRGLQALVVALFKTMKSVVYVLGLMFLLMFIFAIIGYYYFGDPNTGDPENWGDLGCALFTLFSLVTVDGWTDLQQNLDDLGMNSSRIFTIVFILIGYFIFFNMFIGVVIMEIQHATKRFENEVQSEREASLTQKKHAIIQRQKNEIRNLIQSQTGNFTKLVQQFNKSLRHTDYTVMEDLCTSMSFIDIYLTTLDHQDTTVNKLQQLYSEAVLILSDLLEEDLIEMEQKALRERKIKMRA